VSGCCELEEKVSSTSPRNEKSSKTGRGVSWLVAWRIVRGVAFVAYRSWRIVRGVAYSWRGVRQAGRSNALLPCKKPPVGLIVYIRDRFPYFKYKREYN